MLCYVMFIIFYYIILYYSILYQFVYFIINGSRLWICVQR